MAVMVLSSAPWLPSCCTRLLLSPGSLQEENISILEQGNTSLPSGESISLLHEENFNPFQKETSCCLEEQAPHGADPSPYFFYSNINQENLIKISNNPKN